MSTTGKIVGPPDVEQRISEHLEAIDKVLAARGVTFSERRSVTGDVDLHIREMLAARNANAPTLPDVQAVLDELDPPESYATTDASEPATPTGPTRTSRAAILGALWTPWLLIAVFLGFVWSTPGARSQPMHNAIDARGNLIVGEQGSRDDSLPSEQSSPFWGTILMFTVLPLGLAAPFGTTILGIVALGQIRRSKGRLTGRGLALFDVLFYPLLLLDGLLWALTYYAYAILASWHNLGADAFARPSYSVADQNMGLIFAIAAAVSIIVDYFIVRWAWRSGAQTAGD